MTWSTHRHEDHALVAGAMTDRMQTMEMKMIHDMGANFIRLGHYQQSDRILELCDSLGIIVWEEIPWCRGGVGGTLSKAIDFLLPYSFKTVEDWPWQQIHGWDEVIRDYARTLYRAAKLDTGRSDWAEAAVKLRAAGDNDRLYLLF